MPKPSRVNVKWILAGLGLGGVLALAARGGSDAARGPGGASGRARGGSTVKPPSDWQGPRGASPTAPITAPRGLNAAERAEFVRGLPPLKDPNPKSSRLTRDLEPSFAAKLDKLFAAMKAREFAPSLIVGWRNEAWQRNAYLKGTSRLLYSLHTVTYPDGRPAGLAADVVEASVAWPKGSPETNKADWDKAAAFFHALREEAKKLGLDTGGDYAQHDKMGRPSSEWTKYGLGWDPAHVMLSRDLESSALAALREHGPAGAGLRA
jgi:hypothetical protein